MNETDALRGWLLALIQDFEQLQTRIPQLREMQPANLAISASLRKDWGHWDEQKRLITLARRLFDSPLWEDVQAVYYHEVAHQIVSELFRVPGAQPHGEAFERACKLLEIPMQTTFRPRGSGKDPVRRRIEKLLALGQSNNQHEAEKALSKAHELSLRHNLSVQPEVHSYSFRLVGPAKKRLPRYYHAVSNIVADFYFVRYIANCYQSRLGIVRQIELYGTLENLDSAEYVFYFLVNQGEAMWYAYQSEIGARGVRAKLSYLDGLYHGFYKKLERRSLELEQSVALVWTGDPGLEAFYRERNPGVITSSRRQRRDRDALLAGMADGEELEIAPGVGARRDSGRLLGE